MEGSMDIKQLENDFKNSRAQQEKALFATLFIVQNKLKTRFDQSDSQVTLRQFMLLVIVKQAKLRNEQLTFTQLGEILGCSRQNIKKLAQALEKHGWCKIVASEQDARALKIVETDLLMQYFDDISEYHQNKLRELFAVFSEEEMVTLFQLMNKLNHYVSGLEESYE